DPVAQRQELQQVLPIAEREHVQGTVDLQQVQSVLPVLQEWHRRVIEHVARQNLGLQMADELPLGIPPRKGDSLVSETAVEGKIQRSGQALDNKVVVEGKDPEWPILRSKGGQTAVVVQTSPDVLAVVCVAVVEDEIDHLHQPRV